MIWDRFKKTLGNIFDLPSRNYYDGSRDRLNSILKECVKHCFCSCLYTMSIDPNPRKH